MDLGIREDPRASPPKDTKGDSVCVCVYVFILGWYKCPGVYFVLKTCFEGISWVLTHDSLFVVSSLRRDLLKEAF